MTGGQVGPVRASPYASRGLVLRWGLPRDPNAPRNLTGFLVSAVITVIVVRGVLAATGYPQLGGDGLHIAHVLWGGLIMALSLMVLISFAGPMVRPLAAVLGGIGFGLFIDEIGKFVTDDNDYFFAPTAALIYLVVVFLVLLVEALHGRIPYRRSEYLAACADHAAAGLAGGFTPHERAHAHAMLARAGDLPGTPEVEALLNAIDNDPDPAPNPIAAVSAWIVRASHRAVGAKAIAEVTVAILFIGTSGTVLSGLLTWSRADMVWWIGAGLLLGGAMSATLAVRGLLVVRSDRVRAYVLFRRAVLVSLLVTQWFAFLAEQFSAVWGLAVDLLVLALIAAELDQAE